MPGVDSIIFSAALTALLFLSAASVIIDKVNSFVISCKKLRTTIRSSCSADSEDHKLVGLDAHDRISDRTVSLFAQVRRLSSADQRLLIKAVHDRLSQDDLDLIAAEKFLFDARLADMKQTPAQSPWSEGKARVESSVR